MLFVLASFAFSALMPIPNRYPGLKYGTDSPTLEMEVYADPLCPICAMFWPTVEQIVQDYGNVLRLTVHFLPLPYHTWSFVVSRSLVAVEGIDTDKAKEFLKKLYDGDQNLFDNSAMSSKGQTEVVNYAADYVQKNLGISQSEFIPKYNNADEDTRIEFKFAASHGVNGTPIVYVNGVETDLGAGTPYSTWKSFLDGLLE